MRLAKSGGRRSSFGKMGILKSSLLTAMWAPSFMFKVGDIILHVLRHLRHDPVTFISIIQRRIALVSVITSGESHLRGEGDMTSGM